MKIDNNPCNVNRKLINIELYFKIIKLKKQIDKINNIKLWNHLVRTNNPYELVPYIDVKKRISRAFYKLLEINKYYNIIDKNKHIITGHLCESPGGFIECVKYINNDSESISLSLKDSDCKYNESILNNCIITYGSDGSGDIYKSIIIKDFIEITNEFDKCDLITGDGGFDVSSDYLKQEQLSFKLIYCQAITALGSLKIDGHFVCKIFDIYTTPTLQLLYLLKTKFKEFYIIKPYTSRPCNSEKYIVCKFFKGIIKEELNEMISIMDNINNEYIINLDIDVPIEFIEKIKEHNNNLINNQIKSLIEIFDVYNKGQKIVNIDHKNISKNYLEFVL